MDHTTAAKKTKKQPANNLDQPIPLRPVEPEWGPLDVHALCETTDYLAHHEHALRSLIVDVQCAIMYAENPDYGEELRRELTEIARTCRDLLLDTAGAFAQHLDGMGKPRACEQGEEVAS